MAHGARLPSRGASDARAASLAEGEVRSAAAVTKEGARPEQPIAPEIAGLARALPPAAFAAASAAGGGAPLVLSLGRALDVELRCGPSGIELVLRPSARLLAATQRELPQLVAALAARGITVSRAEIRGRTVAPSRRRAR